MTDPPVNPDSARAPSFQRPPTNALGTDESIHVARKAPEFKADALVELGIMIARKVAQCTVTRASVNNLRK